MLVELDGEIGMDEVLDELMLQEAKDEDDGSSETVDDDDESEIDIAIPDNLDIIIHLIRQRFQSTNQGRAISDELRFTHVRWLAHTINGTKDHCTAG